MRINELVKYLKHFSKSQIYNMVSTEKIPYTNNGTELVFNKQDIDKWNFKRLQRINQDLEFYNMQESCQLTGLSKRTIYQYVNDNKIPFVKRGKFLMFDKKKLHEYINNITKC